MGFRKEGKVLVVGRVFCFFRIVCWGKLIVVSVGEGFDRECFRGDAGFLVMMDCFYCVVRFFCLEGNDLE